MEDQIGSLAKGKVADIIAVPGDLMSDAAQLEHVDFFMKGWQVIKSSTSGQPLLRSHLVAAGSIGVSRMAVI